MALFFDVGGTLWPDGPRDTAALGIESRSLGQVAFLAAAAARLAALGLERADAEILAAALADDAAERVRLRQDTLGHVRTVLDASQHPSLDPAAVLEAMCVPAQQVLEPFPGSIELLRDLKAAGHLLALVSNTQWRSAARYREDFGGWHAEDCFDAYVTSLDVGFRKPHPAMLHRALHLLGAAPGETVMIGDSPSKDMAPAKKLGMRTVLVAMQGPPGDTSRADAVVRSMSELRTLLMP